MYQFVFDIKPYLPLYKALGFDYEDDPYGQRLLADAVERLGLSPGQQNYLHKLWSGKKPNVCNLFRVQECAAHIFLFIFGFWRKSSLNLRIVFKENSRFDPVLGVFLNSRY